MKTAYNPETKETAVLVDGNWVKANAVAENKEKNSKAYLINGKWITDEDNKKGSPASDVGKIIGDTVSGNPEAMLSVASSMVSAPVAGLAGIAQGVKNLVSPGMSPGDRVNQVQEALTYQPRSEAGKNIVSGINYPFQKLAEGADYVGDKVNQKSKSPVAATVVNTAIQSIPSILLRRKAGGIRPEEPLVSAEERARSYATDRAGLDWNSLSDSFKKKLTNIAEDSKNLNNLDPQAVARQARLDSLKVPATRGQITRDLGQITKEENLSKSESGRPIREINAAQDQRLHDLIDDLRKDTGAKADTRQGVGKSVQEAERSKLNLLKKEKNEKYEAAKNAGATLEPVDIGILNKWLDNPTNRRNAPYLVKAIKDYAKDGKVKISDLEEIRKEANANSKTPGPAQHFAGEAKEVIDQILDESGSNVYKEARAANRALNQEFDRQERVKKLVSEKGYSSDRAVALEDTFDHFIKGSSEDIEKIKSSLLEGGNEKTRAQGIQAWKDLQGATLDYLKEKASGKRAIVGENEQLQFNSSFREAFSELEKDGKIDAIFSKQQADMLRKIYDAVGDVRTKPSGRISGSDTTPRIISLLEKVEKIPVLGDVAAGTIKAGQKLHQLGKEEREVRSSTTTPIDDAVRRSESKKRKVQTLKDIDESSRKLAPAAPLTLKKDKNK